MTKFMMDPDAVDVSKLPVKTLNTGAKIPAVGIGTFGSDHASYPDIANAVRGALRVGYRFVDCASVYGDEDLIGNVLHEALEEGLPGKSCLLCPKFGMTCTSRKMSSPPVKTP